ncbi:MAG TPA: hypothetical protein VMV31_14240 [Terriglobales bacterium]|nr:hypothetical protein [Terriglobales bacterium]
MTTGDVANHLGARQTGPGRWTAKCPAHDDHNPSLSIAEGGGGRTLVRCWAGCRTADVLAAAGLTWAHILGGAPGTPADRARLRAERELRQAAEAAQRQHQRAKVDLLRDSDTALGVLAARLMTEPGGGGEVYHALWDAQRIAEGVDPWA